MTKPSLKVGILKPKFSIKIAVERAITDMLDDLKFYYVAQTEVEDEENIPTEPNSERWDSSYFNG